MKLTGSDIHLLHVFDSVVRNNGFSAAQVELGLSQPTISNHITALEERLGVKLCQRGRRGFLLTEKGRIVHEIGQGLIGALGSHSQSLAALRGKLVGRLKIAVVDAVNSDPAFRVPQAIRAFTDEAPMVRIELDVMRPQDIMLGVTDGSCHVGIGSFDNPVNGLTCVPLYDELHALHVGAGHPLFARAQGAGEAEIDGHPWVHRGYWNQQRRKSVIPTERDVFVQQIEAQLTLVLSGGYLGLLPCHLAAPYIAAGRLRRLGWTGADFTCTIQAAHRSGPLPKVIDHFVAQVRACHEA